MEKEPKSKQEILGIIEEAQEKYDSEPLLILKKSDYDGNGWPPKIIYSDVDIPPQNLVTFVRNYFGDYKQYHTFKNGEVYCSGGRSRSLGDIYSTAKSYVNEDFNLYDLIKLLYDFVESDETSLYTIKCCDIHKRVYNTTGGFDYKKSYKHKFTDNLPTKHFGKGNNEPLPIIEQDYITLFS